MSHLSYVELVGGLRSVYAACDEPKPGDCFQNCLHVSLLQSFLGERLWQHPAELQSVPCSQLDRVGSSLMEEPTDSETAERQAPVSPQAPEVKRRASTVGQALMFVAALFWGSNPAALRYLYTSPGPPDAAVLSAAQTGLAAIILLTLSQSLKAWRARRTLRRLQQKDALVSPDSDRQKLITQPASGQAEAVTDQHAEHGSGALAESAPLHVAITESKQYSVSSQDKLDSRDRPAQVQITSEGPATPSHDLEAGRSLSASSSPTTTLSVESVTAAKSTIRQQIARLLNWSTDDVRIAGLELGMLTFTANAVTIIGFALATASRGAFLLRSSIVSTPILSTLAGIAVGRPMWGGAILGFTGSVLISTDPVDTSVPATQSDTYISHVSVVGDLLIVCAAVLWSGVMVRQSRHAVNFSATDLVAVKLTVMACLSFVWLIADIAHKVLIGQEAVSVWAGFRNPVAWLVLLWPAVGPWSTAEIAQVEAQSRISASHGQIILAIDPLLSVAFAGLVNPAEQHLGVRGWFGGGMLVLACLVASQGESLPVH